MFDREPVHQPGEVSLTRVRLISRLFMGAFALLGVRAVTIHLFPPSQDKLETIAKHQYFESVTLSPYRGVIYDRRNEPLALSVRLPSVYINPKVFKPDEDELGWLMRMLRITSEQMDAARKKSGYFAWLKRKIPESLGDQLQNQHIDGLYIIKEPARFYPQASAAHLIGAVGLDDKGIFGLENFFEKDLQGQAVSLNPSVDARGMPIYIQADNNISEKAGNSIHLTIDTVVQDIANDALVKWARKARAKSGFAIVSDPYTGKILALANYPSFNPNDRKDFGPEKTKNHALIDIYEPGSVMKPFVIGTAIEKKKTTPFETHDCENGFYAQGSIRIHDDHPQKTLTTEEAVIYSSNICTFKIGSRLGKQGVYEAIRNFGLGGAGNYHVQFPGEMNGRLSDWNSWAPSRFASVTFGQGVMVSALEMVQGYGALANGGKLMAPYLIERIEGSDGVVLMSNSAQTLRNVISPETARAVRRILHRVVMDGTGNNAATFSYSTGGKTGTAQKANPATRGYSLDKRTASFIGFAPVEDPRLVVYVVIDEPNEKPYFGATWAAPAFSEIVEQSLKYMNVAPDDNPLPEPLKRKLAQKQENGHGQSSRL